MHQRGQCDLRMLGHFDLQRSGAMGAQALGQPVGNRCGLGRFVFLAFVIAGSIRATEP